MIQDRAPEPMPWFDRFLSLWLLGILGGAFFFRGHGAFDFPRALAYSGCAIALILALLRFAVAPAGERFAPPFIAILTFLGFCLVWGAIYFIPLPAGLVVSVSGFWKGVFSSAEAAGIEMPGMVPLALDAERGIHALNQLIACLCFAVAAGFQCCRLPERRFLLFGAVIFSVAAGWLGFVNAIFGNAAAETGGRATGALFNPNHHAASVFIGLPAAIALLLRESQKEAGDHISDLARSDKFFFLGALVLFGCMGWLMAYSRASLIIGSAALLLWGGWEFARAPERANRQARQRNRLLVAILFGAGILILGIGPFVFEPILRRIESAEGHLFGRFTLWQATLAGLWETSLIGYGYGGSHVAINAMLEGEPSRKIAFFSHNDYAQIAGELGLVGLLGLLGFAAWIIRSGFKYLDDWKKRSGWDELLVDRALLVGLGSTLAHSFFDFPLRPPAMSFLFLLMAACLFAGNSDYSSRRRWG